MSKSPKNSVVAAHKAAGNVAGKAPANDVYADYTPMQLRSHLRKAIDLAARQDRISKAGEAAARLEHNADYVTMTSHLRDTVTQMLLDSPQRASAEARTQDQVIMQSIAVVLDMLTTLPEVGESMAARIHDTNTAIDAIKAKL